MNDHNSATYQEIVAQPEAWQAALLASDAEPAPKMSAGKSQIRQLDFTLGRKDLPINRALKEALEKVLFEGGFGDVESTGRVA